MRPCNVEIHPSQALSRTMNGAACPLPGMKGGPIDRKDSTWEGFSSCRVHEINVCQ